MTSPITDPTGLFSEDYFHIAVETRVSAARRISVPWRSCSSTSCRACARHADRVAPEPVVQAIRTTLREADTACRLADGRFGFVLEDTPEDGAIWTVERFRRALSDANENERDAVQNVPGRHCLLPGACVLGVRDAWQGAGRVRSREGLASGPHRGRNRHRLTEPSVPPVRIPTRRATEGRPMVHATLDSRRIAVAVPRSGRLHSPRVVTTRDPPRHPPPPRDRPQRPRHQRQRPPRARRPQRSSTTAAASAEANRVAMADNATIGQPILVNSAGMTIYLFVPDGTSTTSAVPEGIKANWPPVVADGTPVAG